MDFDEWYKRYLEQHSHGPFEPFDANDMEAAFNAGAGAARDALETASS